MIGIWQQDRWADAAPPQEAEFAGSRTEEVNMNSWLGRLLKCFTVSLFLFFCFSPRAFAAQAQLAWNQSTDPAVIGYRIHYGTQSGNYSSVVDAGNNLGVTVDELSASQTYYFAATSYSSANESSFSPELACDFVTVTPPSNGQITPGGTVALIGGSSQEFSIVPDPGYQVSSVVVDGSSAPGASTSYTFSNISGSHTITAVFTPATYTITATAGTGGAISPAGAQTASYGATEVFTIAPQAGFVISEVIVDGTNYGAISSYTFNSIAANHNISATFAQSTYTITASAGAGGSISPPGAQTVNYDANEIFTISPNIGYSVSSVVVDGTNCGAITSYTFSSVTANHTISATFIQTTYTITSSAGSGGSISPPGAQTVNYGANEIFNISPNTGYSVSSVVIDGTNHGAITSYTFSSVTANHTISATFAEKTYNIYASAGAGGSISPYGSHVVHHLTSSTYTITPWGDYSVSAVIVDGKNQGAATSYTFNDVTSNHTISATFTHSKFVISSIADTGGSISPSGSVSVSKGGEAVYTITADARHKFTAVLIDDKPYGSESCGKLVSKGSGSTGSKEFTYTFTDVSANHKIQAAFASVPGPVVDPGPDQNVKSGSIVLLNGGNSTDPEVGIVSFKWTQVSGPPVKLTCPSNGRLCSFKAPETSSGMYLGFKLEVTNKAGLAGGAYSVVNVSASAEAPQANAGAGLTVQPYTNVTLDGSKSYDPDGEIVSYKWVQLKGPTVQIQNADTAVASFVAPNPATAGVTLVFNLWVKNSLGLRSRDQISINVVSSKSPPVANAGHNQNASENAKVTLDGSGSSDPAKSTDSYRWKQISGRPVTLSNPTVIKPVFSMPVDFTGALSDELVFMLTVTDVNDQMSTSSKCVIAAKHQ
jgi:hypothetical protein